MIIKEGKEGRREEGKEERSDFLSPKMLFQGIKDQSIVTHELISFNREMKIRLVNHNQLADLLFVLSL